MFKLIALCTLIVTISGVPSKHDVHQSADTVASQPKAQVLPVQLLKASLSDSKNEELLNAAFLKVIEEDNSDLADKDPALRPLWLIMMMLNMRTSTMAPAMMPPAMMPPAMMPPAMMPPAMMPPAMMPPAMMPPAMMPPAMMPPAMMPPAMMP